MIPYKDLPDCPVATTVKLIGNKWKPLILRELIKGTQRYKYLLYRIEGISAKVLTENLRQMEDDGLIKRDVYPESLAEFGKLYKQSYKKMPD